MVLGPGGKFIPRVTLEKDSEEAIKEKDCNELLKYKYIL